MIISFALFDASHAEVIAFSTGRFALGDLRDESALSSDYDASHTRPENDFRPTRTFPRINAAFGIDQLRYSSCWHGRSVGHQPSFAQRLEHE